MDAFRAGMREFPAGKDLETRIPKPAIVIPGTTIGDRLLVVLSQIRRFAQESGLRIEMVEKLALAYTLLDAKGEKPRGVADMARLAVGRLGEKDTELNYSHFFDVHEGAEAAFVVEYEPVYRALHGRSLRLR